MPEPPPQKKINKWIAEGKRIIHAPELRLLTIHDLGLFNRRFRFLFANGRFIDFIGDHQTRSGINIYRPPRDLRVNCRDAWRLKYLSRAELLLLRSAGVKYLQISGNETSDMVAYHWLRHQAGLPGHIFSIFNHFVFVVHDVSELLKIPEE
jgi:hypothetical protein